MENILQGFCPPASLDMSLNVLSSVAWITVPPVAHILFGFILVHMFEELFFLIKDFRTSYVVMMRLIFAYFFS